MSSSPEPGLSALDDLKKRYNVTASREMSRTDWLICSSIAGTGALGTCALIALAVVGANFDSKVIITEREQRTRVENAIIDSERLLERLDQHCRTRLVRTVQATNSARSPSCR